MKNIVVDGETLSGVDLNAPMAVNGVFLLDALKPFVLTDGFVHMLLPVRVK